MNSNLIELGELAYKKNWRFPSWDMVGTWEQPTKYPVAKIKCDGVLNFSTSHYDYGTPHQEISTRLHIYYRSAQIALVRDMMKRLQAEIRCDGPPYDTGHGSDAWVLMHNGVPISCMTTHVFGGERFMLGAWTAPSFRRTGAMTNLWRLAKLKHGNILRVCDPSDQMKSWMVKNGLAAPSP